MRSSARRRGLAGEPVAEQVGDQQRAVGEGEEVRRFGGELVERVERQELQPVARVELGVRHPLVDGLRRRARCGHRGSGTGCRAAGPRGAGRSRPPTSPCRCCGSRARRAAPRAGRSGCAVQRREVPVQSVGGLHRVVRESRDRRRLERVGADVADHDPSARRAEVDRRDRRASRSPRVPSARDSHAVARVRIVLALDSVRPSRTGACISRSRGRCAQGHRRNAAATPESTGMCRPVVRVSSGPVST